MTDGIFLWLPIAGCAALGIAMLWLLRRRAAEHRELAALAAKLDEILTQGTGEKLMLLTENRALPGLLGQINRALVDRQRLDAEHRRAEQSARQMLSNISHDIKTPLTVILGYTEMMQLRGQTDPAAIAKIDAKARQVLELVEKFFTLAKIESGDTDLPAERVNISELCRETAVDFFEILTEQAFTVSMEIPEEDLYGYGHGPSIARILYNLISNAIRYGGEGRYLGVALYPAEQTLRIRVTDHGPGIEPQRLGSVFDRLYTADDSRSPSLGGSGLGLAISKALAERMGGTLEAASTPGVETVFTLTLPRLKLPSRERNS